MEESSRPSPLFFYMANFFHLMTSLPDFRFRKPPPADVKRAQLRSVFDFFISYRHGISKAYAETLANELRDFGYQVYFAGEVLELDDEQLRDTLRTELHKSSVLIIIGNKNICDDYFGWVRWEMETFDEGHWGRKVPLITEEMGSPIGGHNSLSDYVLKTLRRLDSSTAIVYEEGESSWQNQKPSSTTIFCLILVREFFRVELEFWHKWAPMPSEQRFQLYLEALYNDPVCRTTMMVMDWPDRDYSLNELKINYFKPRSNTKSLKERIQDIFIAIYWNLKKVNLYANNLINN